MPRIVFLLSLLLVVGGCTLHDIRQPKLPQSMPGSFPFQKEGKKIHLGRWWEEFDDTGLNQLMKKSLSTNLDIQQAISRLRQSQILYYQAESAQLPWLNLNASAGRNRTPTTTGSLTDNSFSTSLTASYELDLWKKIASAKQAAAFRQQASYQEIRSLFLSLSARIAETWYQRQEKAIRLQLLNKIIPLYKDRLAQVEKLYENGLTDVDRLYRTRQSLDMAIIRRPAIEASLAQSDNALALLSGVWAGAVQPKGLRQLPDIVTSFPSGLPADLLQQRPDVAATFARLQAADAEIAVAVANRLPTIQLTANYGYQNNELSNLLDPGHSFWSLIGGLTQPIFDAGKRKQQVDYKKEVYEEQLLVCQKSLLQAFSDVVNALNSEKAADTVIGLHKQRLENSLRDRNLTEKRYEQGLASYLDLIEIDILHLENRLSHLSATLQRITARISLAKALGGNWMNEAIHQNMKRKQENNHE